MVLGSFLNRLQVFLAWFWVPAILSFILLQTLGFASPLWLTIDMSWISAQFIHKNTFWKWLSRAVGDQESWQPECRTQYSSAKTMVCAAWGKNVLNSSRSRVKSTLKFLGRKKCSFDLFCRRGRNLQEDLTEDTEAIGVSRVQIRRRSTP